ncbi:uncharacterized protein P884DRAFT_276976 [Thermothelomyces heterothallicus CBS 202.75]|uniref:uncharacterized protein n=1 Tax=Thermothelomyces heterothallicus CBS 202.75 TaxID=1149848 RepID=UPI0037440D22
MPTLSKFLPLRRLRRHKVTTSDAAQAPNLHINNNAVDEQPQGQPAQAQDTAAAPSPAAAADTPISLESLPPELRHNILILVLDIQDLKALVLASPVFHQQYLLDRKAFLGRALKASLGNVLIDAYAVRTSALLHEQHPADRLYQLEETTVRLFMDNYVALRSVSLNQLLAEVITSEDDLAAMASFYCSVAGPLVQQFAALFLRHLDPSLPVGSLSRIERTRLLRALYRFQLYCNLFGVGPRGYCSQPPLDISEILPFFFCVFRPWEIEEIHCIYIIMREKYEAVFDAIRADVARDNPRFSGWRRPDTPPGSFDLGSEFLRESLRQGTAARGLRVFSKVLQTTDHEKLVKRMQKYMRLQCVFIEPILNWTSQDLRRREHPSEEDRAEARRERLPFLGDKEDAPPLAWVILWRGKYVNEYGDVIDYRLKKWGFIFWDCRRLNESGAKHYIRGERR